MMQRRRETAVLPLPLRERAGVKGPSVSGLGTQGTSVVAPLPHPRPFSPRGRGEKTRNGFTLMEMLLVLAILVLAVGISFPALNRLYVEHNLKEAAQLVQSRLATSRVHALDEGVPYQFLFELNGTRFLIIPEEPDAQATAGANSSSGALMESVEPRWKMTGNIEQGILFEAAPTTLGTGHVSQDWLVGLPGAEQLANVTWAAPITFYPDGTSSGGDVQVADSRQEFIRLTVRGLTGGVTVSPIQPKGRL